MTVPAHTSGPIRYVLHYNTGIISDIIQHNLYMYSSEGIEKWVWGKCNDMSFKNDKKSMPF